MKKIIYVLLGPNCDNITPELHKIISQKKLNHIMKCLHCTVGNIQLYIIRTVQ